MGYANLIRRINFGLVVLNLQLSLASSVALTAENPQQTKPDSKTSPQSQLIAVSPVRNDLYLDDTPNGQVSQLPAPVVSRIRALVKTSMERWKGYGDPDFKLTGADFLGPIQRFATPYRFHLYVFRLRQPFGKDYYYFYLYNSETNTVTKAPPSIYAKWMNMVEPSVTENPIVSFRDLDGDGNKELVVQERVHNGTMYNAIVYHDFRVRPDLTLQRMLALESQLVDLYTENEDGIIIRTTETISLNELRLIATLEGRSNTIRTERLGEAILRRAGPERPYEVVSRRVFNEKYRELIVSAFGTNDDNQFLRAGYQFHY